MSEIRDNKKILPAYWQILDAAKELFAERGYRDTTVRLIAKKAGVNGASVNYYFRSKEQFARMVDNNELLEWAEFCGNYYGTPRFHVESVLQRNKIILLEIDIQGAQKVKFLFPNSNNISFFGSLLPESFFNL